MYSEKELRGSRSTLSLNREVGQATANPDAGSAWIYNVARRIAGECHYQTMRVLVPTNDTCKDILKEMRRHESDFATSIAASPNSPDGILDFLRFQFSNLLAVLSCAKVEQRQQPHYRKGAGSHLRGNHGLLCRLLSPLLTSVFSQAETCDFVKNLDESSQCHSCPDTEYPTLSEKPNISTETPGPSAGSEVKGGAGKKKGGKAQGKTKRKDGAKLPNQKLMESKVADQGELCEGKTDNKLAFSEDPFGFSYDSRGQGHQYQGYGPLNYPSRDKVLHIYRDPLPSDELTFRQKVDRFIALDGDSPSPVSVTPKCVTPPAPSISPSLSPSSAPSSYINIVDPSRWLSSSFPECPANAESVTEKDDMEDADVILELDDEENLFGETEVIAVLDDPVLSVGKEEFGCNLTQVETGSHDFILDPATDIIYESTLDAKVSDVKCTPESNQAEIVPVDSQDKYLTDSTCSEAISTLCEDEDCCFCPHGSAKFETVIVQAKKCNESFAPNSSYSSGSQASLKSQERVTDAVMPDRHETPVEPVGQSKVTKLISIKPPRYQLLRQQQWYQERSLPVKNLNFL